MVYLTIIDSYEKRILDSQKYKHGEDGIIAYYIALGPEGPNITLNIKRSAMTETGTLFNIDGSEIVAATGTRTMFTFSEYLPFEVNGENYRASLGVKFGE